MYSHLASFSVLLFVASCVYLYKKKNTSFKDFYLPFLTFFIGLTYYHLSNPFPHDLQIYWKLYQNAALNPLSIKDMVIRDPAGYGAMVFLAQVFPHRPESYYFLNILIWALSVFIIFKEILKKYNLSSIGQITVFLFSFFLLFDIDDLHHSMRHSTACGLIALSLVFSQSKRKTSLLLFTLAVLWQGTLLILFPMLFLHRLNLTKKNALFVSLISLSLGMVFSYLNIYELIPVETLLELDVNKFFPRLYAFFLAPGKSQVYELSKSIGHDPFWMLELPFYLLCLIILTNKKFFNTSLLVLITYSFFFVSALRFHFAMILRFESLFELCARLTFLWVIICLLKKEEDKPNINLIKAVESDDKS